MYKRPFILAFLAVMAVAVLPSCGGGGSSGLTVSTASSSTASSALASVASISAGDGHTLAVSTTGTMYSWGANQWSQLGLGNSVNKLSPTQIGTLATWASTATGSSHSLGLRADKTLWAWGLNTNGQLGIDPIANPATSIAAPVVVIGSSATWRTVSAGDLHSAGIKADGSLFTWGQNFSGQLGVGDNLDKSVPTAITLSTIKTWTAVAAGASHTVAMRSDLTSCAGNVYAWGAGGSGQLGLLLLNNINIPTCVNLFPFQATAIAAGGAHTIAIRSDGTLWAWGSNASGQLGDGTTTDAIVPIQIGTSTDWIAISAGGSHSVGIQRDASLWTWGSNGYGQLGNGGTTDVLVPTRAGTAANWRKVSAGKYYTTAVKNDGTLWLWGRNDAGQLGNGTTTTNTAFSIP
jgi:alpha-tubulin suppressor-like RCC1 family protein